MDTSCSLEFSHLDPLLALLVVFLGEPVSPVLEGLPDHWRDGLVVKGHTRPGNLADQVALPPPFLAGAVLPP